VADQITEPKTQQDIDNLKENWLGDPHWDIENTPGFEEYREELKAYRLECEKTWQETEKRRQIVKCNLLGIPGNTTLLTYIEILEDRISTLETRLDEAKIR
jgi:hypothetical protein